MSDNTDYDMQQWLALHPPGPKQPTHAQLIDGGDQVKRFEGTAPTDMSESAVVQMCVPASRHAATREGEATGFVARITVLLGPTLCHT